MCRLNLKLLLVNSIKAGKKDCTVELLLYQNIIHICKINVCISTNLLKISYQNCGKKCSTVDISSKYLEICEYTKL